ncbi:unnamed protein product [Prorocentrum cordatum]|uniref:Uncharacterized protein n=1 Tax=Prorocentrum cordatum TaxID=2364126 RepID=A0ABN9YBF2_9DINO|nr:unnamed protein product [Polarella glacialis]
MGRTKATLLEQVENLNVRATETKRLAQKREIMLAMKNRPSCIDGLYEKYTSMGLNADVIKTPETQQKSLSQKAVEKRKADHDLQRSQSFETLKANALADAAGSGDEDMEFDPFGENFEDLASLHVNELRDRVLPGIEPTHLSKANIRSMKDPEARSKSGLLKMITFATGLNTDFRLVGRFACRNRFVAYARKRSLERRRRVLSLSLPPSYSDEGLAAVAGASEDGVTVKNRYTSEMVTVPKANCPPYDDVSDLYIDSNWSESQLALASTKNPTGDQKHNLSNYFKGWAVKVEAKAEPAASPSGGAASRKRGPGATPQSGKKVKPSTDNAGGTASAQTKVAAVQPKLEGGGVAMDDAAEEGSGSEEASVEGGMAAPVEPGPGDYDESALEPPRATDSGSGPVPAAA